MFYPSKVFRLITKRVWDPLFLALEDILSLDTVTICMTLDLHWTITINLKNLPQLYHNPHCPPRRFLHSRMPEAGSAAHIHVEDEPDDWDKRIYSTGCADENTKLNDCFFEKKDWRLCKKEMEGFKSCWKKQNNNERTGTKDA